MANITSRCSMGWITQQTSRGSLVRLCDGSEVLGNHRPDLADGSPVFCYLTGPDEQRLAIILALKICQ